MSETVRPAGTSIAMPSRGQFKKLSEVKTIGEAIRHPDVIDRFRAAVPKHLSPERMLRVCALAVQKTPKLADCDLMSLLGAMLGLAALGLEPNTPLGLAYLIPFEKRAKINGKWQTAGVEVQVIIGYRGYIDLARRAGSMTSIHADVVYDGDEFTFEYGSHAHLRHVPQGVREGRKPLWAYAHARLTDGEAFDVLPYGQVMRVRDASQGYISALRMKENSPRGYEANPWVAHEHEMAAKTMVRRLSKMLPMSIELMNAAALDSASEVGQADLRSLATAPTSGLMDMAMLSHEETIPAVDIWGDEDRDMVEVPREEPKPEQRKAAPRQPEAETKPRPTPPAEAPQDEYDLRPLNELGEPCENDGGEPLVFHDPREFAAWFAGRIAKSSAPEALRDHNMDVIADAGSDREAMRVISEALEPLTHATREAAADATSEADATAPVETAKPSPAHVREVETDAEFVARVKSEVAGIVSKSLITVWSKSVKGRMARLKAENPALFAEASAAVDARWQSITGEGAPT